MTMKGKVAVVTGAARGIGQAIACRLAREGADILALDTLDCSETVERIRASGALAESIAVDLSDAEAVKELSGRMARMDDVRILVNNAGIQPRPVAFEDIDFGFWRQTMAVNIDAVFLLIQILLPSMRQAGWGRIVNLSSSSVNTAPAMGGAYVASKAAVVGLTRTLAAEVGRHGITVNAVAPNPVRTPGAQVPLSDEMFRSIAAIQPIPQLIGVEDVAAAVAFLCSADAALMTGQNLHVDGGMVFGS